MDRWRLVLPGAVGSRSPYDAMVRQMSTALRAMGKVDQPFNRTSADMDSISARLQRLTAQVKKAVAYQESMRDWEKGNGYSTIQGILQQTVSTMRNSPIIAKKAQSEWISSRSAAMLAR